MQDNFFIILVNTLMAWTQKHFCTDTTKSLNRWWCHQMETFSALLAICAGNSPVPGRFPAHRPVTQSFDVFSDMCLNKGLSKQKWGDLRCHHAYYDATVMRWQTLRKMYQYLWLKLVTLLKWTAIIVRIMSEYGVKIVLNDEGVLSVTKYMNKFD